MAEVRKTVWRRSRDGLTEAERRFGGGLSDSLAEVRKTAWRRFERQDLLLRRLESPLFSAKVRKTVWRRFGKERWKKRPGVE